MLGSGGKGASGRLRAMFANSDGKAAGGLDRASLRQAKSTLAAAKRRLSQIHLNGSGFASVETGLRDTYKAGRRALAHVLEQPDDEAFHELRKCVQQHWRQMLLVSHAWPQVCRTRATAAREIAQLLGEEHDFTILAELVASRSPAELPDQDRKLIEKVCKAHQRELRALAVLKTQRLFAEKAGSFARQIAVCWDAARELAKLEKEGDELSAEKPRKAAKPRAPGERRSDGSGRASRRTSHAAGTLERESQYQRPNAVSRQEPSLPDSPTERADQHSADETGKGEHLDLHGQAAQRANRR
jgi:hypothetical protein